MNEVVIEYIRLSSQFSFIIPLGFYFARASSLPKQNHLIGALVCLAGLTDLASRYATSPLLFNLYEVLQFALITWFFHELIFKNKYRSFSVIAILLYAAYLLNSIINYGLHHNYVGLWTLGPSIVLIYVLLYVINIPRMIVDRYFDVNLFSNMIFTASIFTYFFVALIVFFLMDPVLSVNNSKLFQGFWSVHNVFNIVKNVGFAFAFYYTGRRHVYMTVEQLERIAKQLQKERDLT